MGRDVTTSQYLALHWLCSPLIHHPALDLKERNGINHPAGHAARLPFPLRGSYGSRALHCLYREHLLADPLLASHGGWARAHGLIMNIEGLLCFSRVHRWKPKRSLRTPWLDGGGEGDAPGGQTLYLRWGTRPAGHLTATTPALAYTSPTRIPHAPLLFRLGNCIWKVYEEKQLLDVYTWLHEK